eukprot:1186687-Prorocentrum_minimum.AAC.2
MTSFYRSSCANNGKGALNIPESGQLDSVRVELCSGVVPTWEELRRGPGEERVRQLQVLRGEGDLSRSARLQPSDQVHQRRLANRALPQENSREASRDRCRQ